MQSAGMGAWELDLVGRQRHFDEQVCRCLGIDPASFRGTAEEFYQAVHPDDRASIKAALDATVADGSPYEVEYRAVWPDGSVHHNASRGMLVRDAAGTPERVSGMLWDITAGKRVQEALRESEERFRVLSEGHGAPMLLIVPESGAIVDANESAAKFYGHSRERLRTMRIDQINQLPPDEIAAERHKAAQLGRNLFVFPHRLATGEVRWVEVYSSPVTVQGRPMLFSIIHDITARRMAEDALRQSEDRFRGIVETAEEGIATHLPDGIITYVNQRMADMLGYSREEIIGKSSLDFVDEQQREMVVLARQSVREQGSFSQERKLRRKDGSILWTLTNVSPRRDGEGNFIGYLAMHTDITARRQAEEAVRESESRYRQLMTSVPVPLGVVNEKSEIVYLNDRFTETFGYTQADLPTLDEWWRRAYPDPAQSREVMENWHAKIRRSMGTGIETEPEEFHVTCKDGTVRVVVISNLSIGDTVLATFIDITKRKEAEEALRRFNAELEQRTAELARSNEDLKQFAYIASHDLQEPLRTINAFLGLLREDYGRQLDDKARQFINFSMEGATRMAALIRDLLEYSRVDRMGKELQPIDAEKSLAGALDSLHGAIQEAGAEVTHDQLPMVSGDATQLMQLFQNLIGNAVKFRTADRPCKVHVGAVRRDDWWEFSVKDNGIGIDPSQHERVFMIFQRLHARKKYEGTGIGLAVCKKIVERHGGRIWIEPTPGEGSTFHFTLPAVKEEP